MTTDYRVFLIPTGSQCSKQLKTLNFEFNQQNVLLGLSEDSKNLFQIVHIGSTDTKNSWFYGNTVIEDGRMFGLLPVLMGWIFLSLYSKCPQAKSVFLTVDDMLSALYDNSEEDPVLLETISGLFKINREVIEAFLSKLMPSQPNLEGDLGFRFEEEKITEALYNKVQNAIVDENEMSSELQYFEAKWSCASSTAIILDNLQFYLPVSIFSSLCARCSLQPAAPEDLNKRLKLSESMLLKPIKSAKESEGSSILAPTDDYSKFESKLKPEKAKNSKFAVAGNTSMLSFFKKAT